MGREKAPEVNSVDDLVDERARKIAKDYKVDFSQMADRYYSLGGAIGHNRSIDIGEMKKGVEIIGGESAFGEYVQILACNAVVNFELAKRAAFEPPNNPNQFPISRVDEPASAYEKRAKNCVIALWMLEKHKEHFDIQCADLESTLKFCGAKKL